MRKKLKNFYNKKKLGGISCCPNKMAAIVRPTAHSLNDLVTTFSDKVTLLQQLILLNGSTSADTAKLHELDESIRGLEDSVQKVKQNLEADREFIESSKDLIKNLTEQNQRIKMLEGVVPAHLKGNVIGR